MYQFWDINTINALIRVTKILNENLINPQPSVEQENEKSINTQLPVKLDNQKDDSKKIIPLSDFEIPVVLNPLKYPNVNIIYGNYSQVKSQNEDDSVEVKLKEKMPSTNNKTPEKKSSKNKEVDRETKSYYDPAIHNLDGTLRSRPIPTHKSGI